MKTSIEVKSRSGCLIMFRSLQVTQKGQAIVETLTVLIIILFLLLSLRISLNISDSREGLLSQGLSMAISSARGATLSSLSNTVIQHQTDHRHSSQHVPSVKELGNQAMQELGIKSNAWSVVSSHDDVPIHSLLQEPGFIDQLSIKSSIHVKGFSTHASDSMAVVKQLSQTTNLWGKPAKLTSHLANFVSVQAHLTDVAWKRAKPNRDLLMAWKDH